MFNCLSCKAIVPAGATICPSCGTSVPKSTTATTDGEQEVRSLLEQGRKIEAVKLYMSQTGCSLKEAKDAVETLHHGASSPRLAGADADLETHIVRLLKDGEKIKAVKLYREKTGAALAESKQAVESIAARHGTKSQRAGCSVILVVAGVSAAFGVAAVLMVVRHH